ncbi:MAG: hypothetical protein K8E66_03275, partial [Phycisphaerales bacterium]|nr:hypothetical protein [Phycisphaerales bacterium]
MQPLSLHDWSDHLRAFAVPSLEGAPLDKSRKSGEHALRFIETFADERGDRRAVDRPLLAFLFGIHPGPTPELGARHADLRLWWALHDGSPIDAIVSPPPGPIVGASAFESGAIEMTTETELAALHALAHHADRDARWRGRCLDAARWHVAMLQPDN